MTVPARYRGVAGTIPGRTTIPVRVPGDLLAEAERIAERTGEDRAVVLGDLVASALPAALAEAADELVGAPARERLAGHLPDEAQRLGEPPSRASEPCLNADDKLPLPPADELDGSGGVTP